VFKKDSTLDFIFHLKRYGQKNKDIKKIVDQIDKQRVAFGSNLFMEMGFSEEEAKIKSSVTYKYLIGYHELIRYKKQPKNYLDEVLKELNFLKL